MSSAPNLKRCIQQTYSCEEFFQTKKKKENRKKFMFAYYYWIIFVCSNQCDYKQSMKKNDADDENKEKFVRLCHRSKTIINVIIDIKFLSFSTVGDCQQRQKIIMIPIISEMEILLWREKKNVPKIGRLNYRDIERERKRNL